jgi:predicted Zn-dependent peptidase
LSPRRRWLAAAIFAVIAFAGADGRAGRHAVADVRDPARDLRTTTLDNGLTVLTLEDHGTPVVAVQLWVRVGSRDERDYTGLAHLFEHMMFKGSAHIGSEEHARLIEARGGTVNAFTTRDVTVYFEDVTAEALPLVIDLEVERLAHLDVSEGTLASERQVVLEERRLRNEDDPEGIALEQLPALLWQAHPYRWPVIGWRSDIETVTLEVCRRFFRTYYAPNNIVLVVVGDFDSELTLAHIAKRFGRLRASGEVPRNPTREPPQRGERRATVHFDVHSPILAVAWHAPPAGHADANALDVLGQILSGGRSSRLYRRLVYEAQQAHYAQGQYWELADAGLFYAFVGVRPDADVDRAEALLHDVIARVKRDGVEPREVDKAKRQLEVQLVDGLATAHNVAMRLGHDMVTFGRIRPLDERLAAIEAVTAADVLRVARTYLVRERQSVVRVTAPPGEGRR